MYQIEKLSGAVQMLRENIRCSICLDSLKEALTTDCSHHFCSVCYKRLLNSAKRACCPMCNSTVTRRSVFKNEFLDRVVASVCKLITSMEMDTGIDFTKEVLHPQSAKLPISAQPLHCENVGKIEAQNVVCTVSPTKSDDILLKNNPTSTRFIHEAKEKFDHTKDVIELDIKKDMNEKYTKHDTINNSCDAIDIDITEDIKKKESKQDQWQKRYNKYYPGKRRSSIRRSEHDTTVMFPGEIIKREIIKPHIRKELDVSKQPAAAKVQSWLETNADNLDECDDSMIQSLVSGRLPKRVTADVHRSAASDDDEEFLSVSQIPLSQKMKNVEKGDNCRIVKKYGYEENQLSTELLEDPVTGPKKEMVPHHSLAVDPYEFISSQNSLKNKKNKNATQMKVKRKAIQRNKKPLWKDMSRFLRNYVSKTKTKGTVKVTENSIFCSKIEPNNTFDNLFAGVHKGEIKEQRNVETSFVKSHGNDVSHTVSRPEIVTENCLFKFPDTQSTGCGNVDRNNSFGEIFISPQIAVELSQSLLLGTQSTDTYKVDVNNTFDKLLATTSRPEITTVKDTIEKVDEDDIYLFKSQSESVEKLSMGPESIGFTAGSDKRNNPSRGKGKRRGNRSSRYKTRSRTVNMKNKRSDTTVNEDEVLKSLPHLFSEIENHKLLTDKATTLTSSPKGNLFTKVVSCNDKDKSCDLQGAGSHKFGVRDIEHEVCNENISKNDKDMPNNISAMNTSMLTGSPGWSRLDQIKKDFMGPKKPVLKGLNVSLGTVSLPKKHVTFMEQPSSSSETPSPVIDYEESAPKVDERLLRVPETEVNPISAVPEYIELEKTSLLKSYMAIGEHELPTSDLSSSSSDPVCYFENTSSMLDELKQMSEVVQSYESEIARDEEKLLKLQEKEKRDKMEILSNGQYTEEKSPRNCDVAIIPESDDVEIESLGVTEKCCEVVEDDNLMQSVIENAQQKENSKCNTIFIEDSVKPPCKDSSIGICNESPRNDMRGMVPTNKCSKYRDSDDITVFQRLSMCVDDVEDDNTLIYREATKNNSRDIFPSRESGNVIFSSIEKIHNNNHNELLNLAENCKNVTSIEETVDGGLYNTVEHTSTHEVPLQKASKCADINITNTNHENRNKSLSSIELTFKFPKQRYSDTEHVHQKSSNYISVDENQVSIPDGDILQTSNQNNNTNSNNKNNERLTGSEIIKNKLQNRIETNNKTSVYDTNVERCYSSKEVNLLCSRNSLECNNNINIDGINIEKDGHQSDSKMRPMLKIMTHLDSTVTATKSTSVTEAKNICSNQVYNSERVRDMTAGRKQTVSYIVLGSLRPRRRVPVARFLVLGSLVPKRKREQMINDDESQAIPLMSWGEIEEDLPIPKRRRLGKSSIETSCKSAQTSFTTGSALATSFQESEVQTSPSLLKGFLTINSGNPLSSGCLSSRGIILPSKKHSISQPPITDSFVPDSCQFDFETPMDVSSTMITKQLNSEHSVDTHNLRNNVVLESACISSSSELKQDNSLKVVAGQLKRVLCFSPAITTKTTDMEHVSKNESVLKSVNSTDLLNHEEGNSKEKECNKVVVTDVSRQLVFEKDDSPLKHLKYNNNNNDFKRIRKLSSSDSDESNGESEKHIGEICGTNARINQLKKRKDMLAVELDIDSEVIALSNSEEGSDNFIPGTYDSRKSGADKFSECEDEDLLKIDAIINEDMGLKTGLKSIDLDEEDSCSSVIDFCSLTMEVKDPRVTPERMLPQKSCAEGILEKEYPNCGSNEEQRQVDEISLVQTTKQHSAHNDSFMASEDIVEATPPKLDKSRTSWSGPKRNSVQRVENSPQAIFQTQSSPRRSPSSGLQKKLSPSLVTNILLEPVMRNTAVSPLSHTSTVHSKGHSELAIVPSKDHCAFPTLPSKPHSALSDFSAKHEVVIERSSEPAHVTAKSDLSSASEPVKHQPEYPDQDVHVVQQTDHLKRDHSERTPLLALPTARLETDSSALCNQNKKTQLLFVCSSLQPKCIGRVKALAKMVGAKFSDTFVDEVTHLVVRVDENGATLKTLKYVQAVAAGKWIVAFDWVNACLQAKSLVPEDKYEVLDSSGEKGPYKSRTRTAPLFEGYTFCISEPSKLIPSSSLKEIIRRCGGNIVETLDEFKKKHGCFFINLVETENCIEDDKIAEMLHCHHVVTLLQDWALDCVAAWKFPQILPYTVDVTQDELRRLGYPEDILNSDGEEEDDPELEEL